MNAKIKTEWSRRYQAALRTHVGHGTAASVRPGRRLGREAAAIGLETLDVALIHTRTLMSLMSPGDASGARRGIIERAKRFFAETIVPVEKTHDAALKDGIRAKQLALTLRRRAAESSVATRRLERVVAGRQAAEAALRKNGKQHAELLRKSSRLRKQLRRLTREIFLAQENERRKTSRRLYDEIAQTLLGIDVRLLTLKKTASAGAGSLGKEIDKTQILVQESAKNLYR